MQLIMKTGKRIYLSQVNMEIPNDKLIVFWDTCALLDILRIPARENLNINDLLCYERIADYIENNQLVSITSGLVINEFLDHYEEEHNKLLHIQTKLKQKIHDYADFMVSDKKIERIVKAVDLLNIEHRLNTVLNRILKNTFILKEQNKYRDFADYRLRNKMAPAARKAEYKDCYIWGTFVSLVHALNPISPYVAFITVNSKDYTDDTGHLHSHIMTDCRFMPSMCVKLKVGELYGDLRSILVV